MLILKTAATNKKSLNLQTEFYGNILKNLQRKMTQAQLKANNIATRDGASTWLSSLPLKHERFSLTKREFFDAVL